MILNPAIDSEAEVPCLAEYKFIHKFVTVETLGRTAQSFEVLSGFAANAVDAAAHLARIAGKHGVAAEIAKVAPDEILSVELIGASPYLHVVAEVVEHHQSSLGHTREECLNTVGEPQVLVEVEHPAHLEPDGFLIDFGH